MNPQIHNIIFDWGGVLIDLNTEGCIQAFERLGADVKTLLTAPTGWEEFGATEPGALDTPGSHRESRRSSGKEVAAENSTKQGKPNLKPIPPKN